jgi:hypothetical protein
LSRELSDHHVVDLKKNLKNVDELYESLKELLFDF